MQELIRDITNESNTDNARDYLTHCEHNGIDYSKGDYNLTYSRTEIRIRLSQMYYKEFREELKNRGKWEEAEKRFNSEHNRLMTQLRRKGIIC